LLAGLRKNYSTDFYTIRLKGGTWDTEDFAGNPDHITLELGLWYSWNHVDDGLCWGDTEVMGRECG